MFPYCSFAFKGHRVQALDSVRKGPFFWCLGYCSFEDCPVTVNVTVDKEDDLKAKVNFQDLECVHNHYELKRRPVRAHKRDKIDHELEKQLPRAMYLEKMSKMDDDVVQSGCRDEVPTPQVLRNIAKHSKA